MEIMTCNDCIHIHVCMAYEPEEPECICNHFKDKADYAEVKHARWIEESSLYVYCSNCKTREYPREHNFKSKGCPNCLAKMDERS